MGSDPVLDHAPREGVRTFTPRWRNSPLTDERMATLLPARSLPEGPLVPAEAFGRVGPVVLEIGSGHGAAAIAYCAAHPEADLVAVEVHVPGVARMLAAAEEAGVTNLWVHPGDAMPLPHRPGGRRGRWRRCTCSSPTRGRRTSTPSGGSCSSTPSTCSPPGSCPAGCCASPPTSPRYAAHARAQLAHHGRWDVVEGRAPRLAAGRRVRGQGRACRPHRHRARLHPAARTRHPRLR